MSLLSFFYVKHRLGSSSCYVFCASSPCHIYVISYHFCSNCAFVALAVQRLFWLLYAGCWLASFGQGIIHGLRGMCPFSAPPPNTSFQWTAYGSR